MLRSVFACSLVCLPLLAAAEPRSYTVDPPHTHAYFEIDRFQTMTMYGRFTTLSGKFMFDPPARTGSVDLTIPAATVSIGDTERAGRPRTGDEHLRSADFFNVAEFPTMTFKSTKVVFNGDLPRAVEGNLTLLGVTRPVTLTFERFVCAPHPFTKRDNCGGNATATIRRSEFGMKYLLPQIGSSRSRRRKARAHGSSASAPSFFLTGLIRSSRLTLSHSAMPAATNTDE
jgi:polyisoprenoid-binding protein YceI